MANYGEVAGNTNEVQIYEYVKTIINLMTREKDPQGKILIIGGAIASSNNVATTSKGIVTAFTEFKDKLVDNKITIFVRKAGPNYQEGLRFHSKLIIIIIIIIIIILKSCAGSAEQIFSRCEIS